MTRVVVQMDDGTKYKFSARSGYEAMRKMRYTLDLDHEDPDATIDLINGRTWMMLHSGKTYTCFA